MQNLHIRTFANQANLLVPDTVSRRILVPAIVGMAIANFLQPQIGADLNPMTVFNDLHRGNVSRVVSALNEEMIIDVNATIEAAKAMFLVRHRIVNCQPCDYSTNPEFDFMAIVLGISTILPVQTWNAIKESGLSASKMYSLANFMIDDLKKTKFVTL